MKKNLIYKLLLASSFLLYSDFIYAAIDSNQIASWMQKDGYLIFSDPVKLDTLDPIKSINAHSKFTLPLIYEPLITTNAQQELQPALAKSWRIIRDGKSVIITLNPNHKFSDNTEVTAQDVVSSIYRLCSSNSQEYGQMRGLSGCREYNKKTSALPQVFAIDKYNVQFNINTSATTFLYQLSSPSTVIAKKIYQGLIGSGIYVIAEKKADYLILNRNPYYRGSTPIKNLGIVMFYVNGHDAIQMLAKDKPDGALMYQMTTLNNSQNNHYRLIKTNPNITEIMVLNNQRFPFNKPEIRKALSSAIYNNFILSCIPGAHKAYGIIPNGIGGSLTNRMPDYLPEITPSELFKKYPQLKNKKTLVTIHQLNDLKNICESDQITTIAKRYNIDIQFKFHKDYSDLVPLYFNHNLDGFLDLYIFKNREAYNIFEFFAKNSENDANLNQDTIDVILKEAVSTSSSHSRFQVYRRLAQYMQDENIVVPLFYMDHGNLISKCLTGVTSDFVFNPFAELPKISKIKYCQNT